MWQAGRVAVPFLIGVIFDRALHGGPLPWLAPPATVYIGLNDSFRFGERFGAESPSRPASARACTWASSPAWPPS